MEIKKFEKKDKDMLFVGCRRIGKNTNTKSLFIFDIFMTAVLLISSVLIYTGAYSIPAWWYMIVLAALVSSVLFGILIEKITTNKVRLIVFPSIGIVIIVLGIVFREMIKNSFILIVNRMVATINEKLSWTLYDYVVSVPSGKEELYVSVLISAAVFILAPFLYLLIKNGKKLLVTIITGVIAFNGYFFTLKSNVVPLFIYLAALLGFISVSRIGFSSLFGSQNVRIKATAKNRVHTFVINGMVAGVILFGLFGLSTAISLERPVFLDSVKNVFDNISDSFKYSGTRNLNEGKALKNNERNDSDANVLEVTGTGMDSSLYLKGFVGSDFEDGAWTALDQESYAANFGLFAYLEQNEFSALTQISEYKLQASAAGKDMLTINNIGANRRYVYIPYGFTSLATDSGDVIYDEYIEANGFFGQRKYSLEYASDTVTGSMPNLVSRTNRTVDELPIGDGEDGLNYYELSHESTSNYSYMEYEQNYRYFVYQNYLDIPEELESASSALRSYLPSGNSVTYEDVIRSIRQYTVDDTTYSNIGGEIAEESNYVENFVLNTHAGFSNHYASAAVLMFRSAGIPARYVEGYYLDKNAVSNGTINQDGTKTVYATEQNAHAWAEIYADGYGWIPVEVTPGYFDENLIYENGGTGTGDAIDNNESIKPNETESSNSGDLENNTLGSDLSLIIWIVVTIIFASAIALFGYYRISIYVRKRNFKSDNLNKSAIFIYLYITKLIDFEGGKIEFNRESEYIDKVEKKYSVIDRGEFSSAYHIASKARFGKDTVTDVERMTLVEFARKLYGSFVDKTESKFKKLIIQYLYKL